MTKQVLILGASGKIGRHSAHAFNEAGWRVRKFNRGADNMAAAAQHCDVIVNGLNPANYHNWKEIIPQITEEVIMAAKKSGATVMLPGNVYHYGDKGGVWSEITPPNPISRKGKIRLAMERDYADSGVPTVILRAGNFIDPDRQGCVMSEVYLRDIKHNKVILPGPAQFEDIPFMGHTLTAHDIKSELEKILGRNLKFVRFPWWLFKITSPFWELAREMNEMRYLWHTDHALSNERLKQLLPNFKRTPLHEVMHATLPK